MHGIHDCCEHTFSPNENDLTTSAAPFMVDGRATLKAFFGELKTVMDSTRVLLEGNTISAVVVMMGSGALAEEPECWWNNHRTRSRYIVLFGHL
jgi:hypothetical protein